MVAVTRTAHNIEITAEGLQEDLDRLHVQKQALERELAAVTAHLGSVQRALGALQALMSQAGPEAADSAVTSRGGAPAAAAARPEPVSSPSSGASPATGATARPPRNRKSSRASASATKPPVADKEPKSEEDSRNYGKLTEQILEYFTSAGDVDVRAREVAAALGRDADSGSINAVRSTLDRLVGSSRIRRSGRGLYRVMKS